MERLPAIWRQGLTGFQLKITALAAMVIDRIGAVFFPKFDFLRAIGRTAFLLYAFLAAEGCHEGAPKARGLSKIPAEVSHSDYGAFGVLLIVLLYIAGTPKRAAALLAAAGPLYYGAVYSLLYGLHRGIWSFHWPLPCLRFSITVNGAETSSGLFTGPIRPISR